MIPPPRGCRLCSRGFTLIELLVVIMIVLILAAMLFPAIKGMPAQANAAKCVSNLRQIGAGMAGYAVDGDGRFPPRYGPSPLGPYSWYWSDYCLTYIDSAFTKNVGSGASAGIAYYNVGGVGRGFYMAGSKEVRTAHPIFDCPGLANPIKDDEGKPYSTGATHQYHYNGMLDDGFEGGVALSTHRANIEKPSHFIVVMDADSGYLETFGGPSFNPASFAKEYIPSHLGGFHALYADGHVSRENMRLITDYKKQGGALAPAVGQLDRGIFLSIPMNILLAIFLLAFVYCLIPGRVSEPWRTRLMIGLCLAAVAAMGWQYFFSSRHDLGVTSAKYPRSAAYMLGRQVLKDVKKKGEVVVVVSELAKWASDRQLEGLKQALEGSGLKMSEPCFETCAGDSSALAPGKLEKIAAKYPGAVAIVTFLGVPEIREADKTAGLPPVYVFQTGEADDCRAWMEAGLVWGACFYKDEVDWLVAPARASSLESAFKDRFTLATPGDLPPARQSEKQK